MAPLPLTLKDPLSKGRKRPAYLRALGNEEPPIEVVLDGRSYVRQTVFKHDSWAATAVYSHADHRLVCKFNRQASVFLFPMKWVGRFLACRENWFLQTFQGTTGIPKCYGEIRIAGIRALHVSSHDYVEGVPLSKTTPIDADFFDNLELLLKTLHRRRVAYIDLHKAENVIVAQNGKPYLIDFQISIFVQKIWGLNWLYRMCMESDLYHLEKHRLQSSIGSSFGIRRPWWIRLHRCFAFPLRETRRRLLVLIAVRKGKGLASSEFATEVGLK